MTAPVRAQRYDGRHSGAEPVVLDLVESGDGRELEIRHAQGASRVPMHQVRVGERVGQAPRFLQLADGGSLEVVDNAAFDALLARHGVRTVEQRIGLLERRWRPALAAVLAVAFLSWAFVRFGAPALASRAVALMPPSVDRDLGAGALEILDRTSFKPTALPAPRQAELRAAFRGVAAAIPHGEIEPRLEFRVGGPVGANALALPSGIVVLTDELEGLAEHDDELRAVFAHEIGHLVERHAMRTVVQQSGVALLMVGLLGDVGSASSIATAMPAALVSASYSRQFEREADAVAYRWMSASRVSRRRLGDLLARLEASTGGGNGGYLASHPDLQERIRAADALQGDAR